jgi:hypothetical protein
MKKALIHIGTGKTGTTTIQKSLFLSQKKALIPEIAYPVVSSIKNVTDQHYLTIIYRDYERMPRVFKSMYNNREERILKIRDRIQKEYFQWLDSCRNIFISSEYLCGFKKNEIAKLKKDLHAKGFDDIKILVFVRFPPSFYISYLQQVAKASHQILNPSTFRYHFKRIIGNWQFHFPNNILVKAYDPERFYENSLIKELSWIAENFFMQKVPLVNVPRENTSVSLESLFILRQYRQQFYSDQDNLFKKDSERLRSFLAKLDRSNPTQLRLKEGVRSLIIENHRKDLQWLKKEFGVEFREASENSSVVEGHAFADNSQDPGIEDIFQDFNHKRVAAYYNEIIRYFLKRNFLFQHSV